MNKLILIFFISYNAFSQDIIDTKKFESTDGIVLIEFWEDWNKNNQCKWLKDLEGVSCYRMRMNSSLAKKMKVSVLPTLVLFDESQYVEKWEGDITFSLPSGTKKRVQKSVDELNISQF